MELLIFLAGVFVGIVATLALGCVLLVMQRDWEENPQQWEGY